MTSTTLKTGNNDFLTDLIGNSSRKNLLASNPKITRDKHVTLSNGKRITLKPKSSLTMEKEKKIINKLKADKETIDCVNMPLLWEKIRIEEITKKELSDFEKINENLEITGKELIELTETEKNKKKNTLWTEKYRPKKFIDLIGNEQVNARILKWLSDWRYVVKKGKIIDSNTYNRDINIDPYKRPRKKILLIHGPPGIGKTTIAQCVCKQLGFDIQEINSSDERSGVAVKDKIKNSLKMRNLNGKDICLILDEIDGAVGSENGFIRILTNLLNKDIKVTEEWNSFNKLKWNKMEDFIKRPIIALCNDIGAHCLDQLKPYCEIVQFKKTNKKNIKKRLKMILEKEKVGEYNESLLDDLIISLDGDIRNCINFLQFQSREIDGKIKDMEIGWFQILKDIFNLDNKNINNQKSKSEVFNELMTKLNNNSNESDINKINNGCFNLLLQLNQDEYDDLKKLKDINEISNWNYFQDMVHKNYQSFEREDLKFYESITPLKYFNLFTNFGEIRFGIGNNKKDKINFKSQDNFEMRRNINEIVNKLLAEYKFAVNREVMLVNEIFMINYIIIPNKLTIKEFSEDKIRIGKILEIMEDLKISIDKGSFRSNNRFKTSYHTYNKFKPDIIKGLVDLTRGEVLNNNTSRFGNNEEGNGEDEEGNNNISEIKSMPYIKVLLDTIIKQHEIAGHKRKRGEMDEENGLFREEDKSNNNGEEFEGVKKSANVENVSSAGMSSVEYFKRQYNSFHSQLHHSSSNNNGDSEGTKVSVSGKGVMHENDNRIWIKYHEGFSNAVRKEITWKSILE